MSVSLSSLPPKTETPKDVVTCKVFLDGVILSNEIELSRLTINKSFNRIAFAKLVLHDGSAADREFTLSNDGKFKPGKKIKIELGYHQDTENVFEGVIIRHAVRLFQNGGSSLTIEAKDESVRLTMARKSANYLKKKDSQVITTLAGKLAGDIDATSITHEQLVQFECTDWDFIITRAEANGMLVFTDNGKIMVKKPALTPPAVMKATFGENIFEFEAEMDARRQLQKVTGLSWDYTKQKTEKSGERPVTFEETGDLTSSEIAGILGAEVTLFHTGNLKQDQVQNWADAYVLRNKLSKAIGRVRVEGDAAVKPGTMITLEGVGDHFNGNVFVSGVLHQYDGTWYSDIQFGWKDEWFYNKDKVMEKPAAGLLPGVNGLQIGIVQETKDTENGGQYRIKVYVATMDPEPQGIWARVATLDAGADHGVVFRPQKGDEVVLGFLNDDPREAIILGYLHSKDKQKSPLPVTDGNLEYGVFTKEKQKLIFDDTNKRITICATATAGEKTIVLNNDTGAMELKDENNNVFKMDASGITIQSDKIVTIKGKTVMIN